MAIKTASEIKGHYDSLPKQFIKLNGKIYCYDFTALKNYQKMMADEKANLKKQRIDAFAENTQIPETQLDMEYIADMVSLLLVPAPNKKPQVWAKEMIKETKKDFMDDSTENSDVECTRYLNDFFIRRGKRMLASQTLTRNGSSDKMIQRMIMLSSVLGSKPNSLENGSIIPENMTGELKNDSEVLPSGS